MTEINIRNNPVLLCILDGWGHRNNKENNAIALGKTPNWDRWTKNLDDKFSLLKTSGEHVGLPHGQMGNSEVGHMNIGTGRVILQDLPKINQSIQDGSLKNNPVLLDFIEYLKNNNGECHIMGLISKGGVHSHQDQLIAISKIISSYNINIKIHAFLDGRDTAPKSAIYDMSDFIEALTSIKNLQISTISGRYYGMDRDRRWERTKKAYDSIVSCSGEKYADPIAAIKKAYMIGKTDEFIEPMTNRNYSGIKDNDALLAGNFRADRIRQILDSLISPKFNEFHTSKSSCFSKAVGLTEYSKQLSTIMDTIFPSEIPQNSLGEIIAGENLKQLRIAETEKYPHVTFFFNGGSEDTFKGEDRILIPSPKVATYDLKPEMSANEITSELVNAIEEKKYDLVVVNYANGDMVGHTGILSAAIQAVETIDLSLGFLEESIKKVNGTMLITSDHGNCELMVDPVTLEPFTAHTTGDVPLVLINDSKKRKIINGALSDIAPTILEIMEIEKPKEMTGKSLLK